MPLGNTEARGNLNKLGHSLRLAALLKPGCQGLEEPCDAFVLQGTFGTGL